MLQKYFYVSYDSSPGKIYRGLRDRIIVFDRLLADFAVQYGVLNVKYDPYKWVRHALSVTFSPYVRPICSEWTCVESDVSGLCYVPQDQSVEPRSYMNELLRSSVSLDEWLAPLHLRAEDLCVNWAMSYRYAVFCIVTDGDYHPQPGMTEITAEHYTQLSYARNIIASQNLSKHNRIYVRAY